MMKITPFLWFDTEAEEAANFYVSLFPNSKITSTTRYGAGGPGPAGSVMTVSMDLDGLPVTALNGGPMYKFTEAISFVVRCETQAEVDRIIAIWEECLKQSGGPWLFGKDACLADAFYAPVVSRFRTYSIPVSGASKAYCDTIWNWAPVQEWLRDAQRETLRAKFHE